MGSPRLPPDHGGLLPARRRASSRPSCPSGASCASTTSGACGSRARPRSPSCASPRGPRRARPTGPSRTRALAPDGVGSDFVLVGPEGSASRRRAPFPHTSTSPTPRWRSSSPSRRACRSPTPSPGSRRRRAFPGACSGCSSETAETPLAIVDYAHTPDALERALEGARSVTPGRLISVFGAGGDRDTGKRPQFGRVAAALADVIVVTDDNPRSEDPAAIRAEILAGLREARPDMDGVHEVAPRQDAIRFALALAEPGDTILLERQGPRGLPGDRGGAPPLQRPRAAARGARRRRAGADASRHGAVDRRGDRRRPCGGSRTLRSVPCRRTPARAVPARSTSRSRERTSTATSSSRAPRAQGPSSTSSRGRSMRRTSSSSTRPWRSGSSRAPTSRTCASARISRSSRSRARSERRRRRTSSRTILPACVAPRGSYNNAIGLPLTVFRADETTRHLVLEMGANGAGHIAYLASIAPPDVAVVPVVGSAHLGEYGSIDDVASAKAELVEALRARRDRRPQCRRPAGRGDGRARPVGRRPSASGPPT